jgi:hypothetical protein
MNVMWDKWWGGFEERVIQLTGIENVQFNIIPDEGSENGMVQFNNMLVNDSRKGFRVGGLQFNDMPVVNNEGNGNWEEWVGASNNEWEKFLVGMVMDCNNQSSPALHQLAVAQIPQDQSSWETGLQKYYKSLSIRTLWLEGEETSPPTSFPTGETMLP